MLTRQPESAPSKSKGDPWTTRLTSTEYLMISHRVPKLLVGSILQSGFKVDSFGASVGIVYGQDYDGI